MFFQFQIRIDIILNLFGVSQIELIHAKNLEALDI